MESSGGQGKGRNGRQIMAQVMDTGLQEMLTQRDWRYAL